MAEADEGADAGAGAAGSIALRRAHLPICRKTVFGVLVCLARKIIEGLPKRGRQSRGFRSVVGSCRA